MTQVSKINGIPIVDTKVTGFTFDNINTFTITDNEGVDFTASMDSISANTISATTYYGDGSNLTGISAGGSGTYVTGGTHTNGTSTFTNSTGGTFNVVGYFDSFTISGDSGSEIINSGDTIYYEGGEAIKTTISATDKLTIDLDITGTTVEASPTTGDKLIIYEATSGEHRNIDWSDLPSAGGGESNTASNIGGGEGIFSGKSGVDLQFKSLTSTGNTVTISSTGATVNLEAAGGGGSSRTTSSVATTNATTTELEKIDDLTAEAHHYIEVSVTCKSDDDVYYGVWKRSLSVSLFNGTCTIRKINSDFDDTSSGLNANSVSFTVNSTDIDIDVTGDVARNIQWDSSYEIITKSTN